MKKRRFKSRKWHLKRNKCRINGSPYIKKKKQKQMNDEEGKAKKKKKRKKGDTYFCYQIKFIRNEKKKVKGSNMKRIFFLFFQNLFILNWKSNRRLIFSFFLSFFPLSFFSVFLTWEQILITYILFHLFLAIFFWKDLFFSLFT